MQKMICRRRDTGVFLFPFVAMLLGTLLMMYESMIGSGINGVIILCLGAVLMWFSWCKYHEVIGGDEDAT